MMEKLRVLLILTAALCLPSGVATAAVSRLPDAVEVFTCDFEAEEWDRNFDDWPDLWKRREGAEYPHYIEIGLADAPEHEAPRDSASDAKRGKNRGLRIRANWGAAVAESPPIPVRSLFSYVLEADILIDGLENDEVHLTVSFYNDRNELLGVETSDRYGVARNWKTVRVGPMSSAHTSTSYAIIGLHLSPTTRPDLRGSVYMDNVWFARLPRLVVSTNRSHNVYVLPEENRNRRGGQDQNETEYIEPEIRCEVSGLLERDPMLKFEVVDVFSKSIARTQHRLEGQVVAEKSSRASEVFATKTQSQAGYAGTTSWKPGIKEEGFYEARVSMYARRDGKANAETLIDEERITFAIVKASGAYDLPSRGEFGWTLPRGDDPLPLADLEQLVSHVGINWIKFPVWYGASDDGRADQLVRFAERLSLAKVETVGLLHQPPEELHQHYGDNPNAAAIFTSDPQIWKPTLDAVMTRLSLKIRWWQLGLDQDDSFANDPDLIGKIEQIKRNLYQFGQEAFVGIGWRWINEPVEAPSIPWRFLSLSSEPPLTAGDLKNYLAPRRVEQPELEEGEAPPPPNKQALRWVVVEPLPRDSYDRETRATDLIHRMLAAKIGGAEGVFIPNPFDDERGLMHADGTPGELLLPWRTTALQLAGAEYLGSIRMPGGSQNHVFSREGKATMVIWNEKPTEEAIFLGEKITITDIWGRVADLTEAESNQEGRPVISVGPLPVFVTGVSEPIMRMRMSTQFEEERLPSIFGRSHEQQIRLRNFFPTGIDGRLRVYGPKEWDISPEWIRVNLASGEAAATLFEIKLPYGATSGRQEIVVDFELRGQERFSVYRHIDVGLDGISVDVVTHLSEEGDLEVRQQVTNRRDEPISFTCTLLPPKRRRMRTQILQLGRDTDTRTYRLSNGNELIGQTLRLSLEEIGGQRVLNYRIQVKP
ncbi:MAG: hypothetical protein DWQ46_08085 [Planctomycetota bacterium]|nr:MAG: hypothetical protein DWQ46_08085 [Planctomycetota bacterium]